MHRYDNSKILFHCGTVNTPTRPGSCFFFQCSNKRPLLFTSVCCIFCMQIGLLFFFRLKSRGFLKCGCSKPDLIKIWLSASKKYVFYQCLEHIQKTGWVQTPGFAESITNYEETSTGFEQWCHFNFWVTWKNIPYKNDQVQFLGNEFISKHGKAKISAGCQPFGLASKSEPSILAWPHSFKSSTKAK